MSCSQGKIRIGMTENYRKIMPEFNHFHNHFKKKKEEKNMILLLLMGQSSVLGLPKKGEVMLTAVHYNSFFTTRA